MKLRLPDDWLEACIYGLLTLVLIGLAITFIMLTGDEHTFLIFY